MKYARVENGQVVEVIDFDPKGKFVKEIENQFIPCGDNVSQNFIYENNEFIEKGIVLGVAQDERYFLKEISKSNNDLIDFIENIIDFLEPQGLVIPDKIRNIVNSRKENRNKIK